MTTNDEKRVPAPSSAAEEGIALIGVLFAVIVMAGFAAMMQRTSVKNFETTHKHEIETKLLYVAEAGLNAMALELQAEDVGPVKDTTGFVADTTAKEYVGQPQQMSTFDSITRTYTVRLQYLKNGSGVMFADRSAPTESWDLIKITSNASLGVLEREVVGWYRMELGQAFASAVISDALPTDGGEGGKGGAQKGHITVKDTGKTYIFGGIRANGEFWGTQKITEANVATELDGFTGTIQQGLAGTEDQVPDFTSIGGSDQMFDFDRFMEAAKAGAGQTFHKLEDFADAMNTANDAGQFLEGITVLKVNSSSEKTTDLSEGLIPGGINIRGTLLFYFSNGTDANYKIKITTPLNINPADLSSWDPADPSTYTTGYPPTYSDASKAPWNVDISTHHSNFEQTDGFPALMFNNGIVDTHNATNICGVLYGPSLLELENKSGLVQYYHGVMIGGGGVWLENGDSDGIFAVKFDPNTLKNLDTLDNAGTELSRVGSAISK